MKWFKHDTDALQDAKIEKLVMKYGLEGYGLYFACVELIAASLSSDDWSRSASKNGVNSKNDRAFSERSGDEQEVIRACDAMTLEHDEAILAYRFRKTPQKVKEMLSYMVELGLLQYNEDSKHFACIQLLKRVDNTMAQNPAIKELIKDGNFKKLKETLSLASNNFKKLVLEQTRTDKTRTEEIRREEKRTDKTIKNEDSSSPLKNPKTKTKQLQALASQLKDTDPQSYKALLKQHPEIEEVPFPP